MASEEGMSHRAGPLFSSDARWEGVFPAYGCQMFYLSKKIIPTLCAEMRASPFPHGLDRWMFSDKWVPDEKWAYTSCSLAGQWHGESDSWGPGGNANVGFVEEPPPGEAIYLRRMSEPDLRGLRRKVWQKHRKADAVFRRHAAFGCREELLDWLHTPPSVEPPRPPLDPESLARFGGNSMLWSSACDRVDASTRPANWEF